ncbi:MAG: SDR family oxidoreductase, partial [Pseudomonadota bacterium]
ALASDAVIHTAFVHDFSRFQESCAIDRIAIEALGAAIEDTDKPMIVTAGVAFLEKANQVATENDNAPKPTDDYPRTSEIAARALAARGIRASVMRLPPSVHGSGDHGFVPMLIGIAQEKGLSAYIDEGGNHWSAVHRRDAACAFRLAIELGSMGETFHAVGQQGVPFRKIAQAIATGLDVPCRSIPTTDAAKHFTWPTPFAAMDEPASSAQTRERLGWTPTGPELLKDIAGHFGLTTPV